MSRDHRAKGEDGPVDPDLGEIFERLDVDNDGGTGEPKPHRRDEALPASQHAGVGPMLLQGCECLI